MIIAAKAATASAAGLPYRWVATGNAGAMFTCDSTAGTTWTSRTSSFSTTSINWATTDKTSQWVAVGSSGKLATSPNGITWTQRTSSFSTTNIYGVAYGNGTWVAVGASGKAATSSDGITWTQQTSSFSTTDIWVVQYGDGLFVASGASGKVATSTDGVTWTQRTNTGTSTLTGLAYNRSIDIWVNGTDGGTTGAFQSAPDATSTWTARSAPTTHTAGTQTCFASGGANLVSVYGAGTNLANSTNGTSWTNRTHNTTGTPRVAAYDNQGNWLCGGDKLILSTYSFVFSTSTDTVTWTYADGTSAVGSGEIITSCNHSSGMEPIN